MHILHYCIISRIKLAVTSHSCKLVEKLDFQRQSDILSQWYAIVDTWLVSVFVLDLHITELKTGNISCSSQHLYRALNESFGNGKTFPH